MRIFVMLYAAVVYAAFFAVFLIFMGFVGNFPMLPVTVDRGPLAPWGIALVTDVALMGLFGVQHSVMARPWFKRRWTRIVPPEAERSTYVLATTVVLLMLIVLWRPMPAVIWDAGGAIAFVLQALFVTAWGIVLLSTFLINHFELFGLRQAWAHLQRAALPGPRFRTPLLYRLVRHPLYLGFFIGLWATPYMTVGHAVLAVGLCTYMLIAIPMEERDLVSVFGNEYRDYQCRVGMIAPKFR